MGSRRNRQLSDRSAHHRSQDKCIVKSADHVSTKRLVVFPCDVNMIQRAHVLASTLTVIIIIIGAVAWLAAEVWWAKGAAEAAILIYVALEMSAMLRGARIMVAACLAATVATVFLLANPTTILSKGLSEAAFLVGLLAAVSLLRTPAETSPMIMQCGQLMVQQPPGRRFLVLSIGSHLIGVLLNFGVLTLLGTMVTRGNTLEAAGGDARIAAIRKQRMMTAILRGFVLMTVWSPLSLSFAVIQTAVPGLDWWRFLPLQIGLAILLLMLGWFMDRFAFPRVARMTEGPHPSWRPLARLTLLVGAVTMAAVAVAAAMSSRPVLGAMIVVPVAAILWLTAQNWRADPLSALFFALRLFGRRMTMNMPAFRNEFVILGGAMYLGVVLSAFISPAATSYVIAQVPLPAILVTVILAWSVMALAHCGIPQIVTVTVLGSAFSDLSALGIHPLVLASGLMGAWGLSGCTTPVGAATLTVARMADVTSSVVARDWNGRFVMAGALVLAVWMLALEAIV
jgi:hypothetical protein